MPKRRMKTIEDRIEATWKRLCELEEQDREEAARLAASERDLGEQFGAMRRQLRAEHGSHDQFHAWLQANGIPQLEAYQMMMAADALPTLRGPGFEMHNCCLKLDLTPEQQPVVQMAVDYLHANGYSDEAIMSVIARGIMRATDTHPHVPINGAQMVGFLTDMLPKSDGNVN